MLFSCTLLFVMLTTFGAAIPTRSRSTLPEAGVALLDAAKYLTYRCANGHEVGWTRLTSMSESANTMGLVFQKLHQQPLSVYFRRISTGDGELEVPAGLNEVSLAKTAKAVSELDYNDAVEKEIIGCWYQRQTMRQMEITYDEENKQFHVSPLPEDYSKKKKGKKEMSFTEPLGLVPLVEPDSEQTAAYYLAAAGGEWVPNSDAWANLVSCLFFDIQRIDRIDVLRVEQRGVRSMSPVDVIQAEKTIGHLEGVWRRAKRVSSAKQDRIQIKYHNKKGLLMEVV